MRAMTPAQPLAAAALLACLISACASSDQVPERRVGQVLVCHNGDKTLNVSNADYHRHLNHGDQGGPCPETGDGS